VAVLTKWLIDVRMTSQPVCIGQHSPLKCHSNSVQIVLQNNSLKDVA